MNAFHAQKADAILSELSSTKDGLVTEDVEKRREKYGPNKLPEQEHIPAWKIFIRQFNNWFVYILGVATVLSFVYHHTLDGYIILAIVFLNGVIGFVQEVRAENAIEALKSLIVPKAKVLRDGNISQVSAEQLVPGDIVMLSAGDRVPADSRILSARDMSTQESSLTGESFTVNKHNRTLPEKTALGDRSNMVWMGTMVTTGSGTAVVVAIAEDTAIGSIATSIKTTKREETHFRKKTNHLAIQLGVVAVIAAVLTFLIGYFARKLELVEVFLFSVATLVSSIPEGLPAVLAVVLAIGAYRMAKKNAIVRHLPIIEDLSVASVIITDKTGTLTQNVMTARELITTENAYAVTGDAWDTEGEFLHNGSKVNVEKTPVLHKMLRISSLCNAASLQREDDKVDVIGDPTEASFLVAAEKAGFVKEKEYELSGVQDQVPFSQDTRAQAVLVSKPDHELFIIGSEETVLGNSVSYLSAKGEKKLDEKTRAAIRSHLKDMTSKAMRVVAVGYRALPKTSTKIDPALYEKLVFVGFIGIIDPIRKEAPKAVADAHRAGIHVIMATGDHADTAQAIGRDIGLFKGKDVERVYTEAELEEMSDSEFEQALDSTSVFARMTPNMKMRIISTLQKQGKIVAMMGDGVNDAPALKKANVGIAMGTIGTDVAREASDIILQDDNFASLVKAVEQGRLIFNNVRQTSFFMITTNAAEVCIILLSLLVGSVLPLTAIQILWINLITDGIPNLALAAEGQHEDLLDRPPRSKSETIMSKEVIPYLIIVVTLMVVVTLGVFQAYLPFGVERARTAAFALMIFFQLFNAINMRSLEHSIFKIGLFSNQFMTGALIFSFVLQMLVMLIPFMQEAFGLTQLTFEEYLYLLLISMSVIVSLEMYKAWIRLRHHSQFKKVYNK